MSPDDALTPLAKRLATQAAARPLTFSEFMTAALYDPEHGYYAQGARIGGEGGDFYTAASLPGFARALARGLRDFWEKLDRPDPFTVIELGAGTGDLAVDLLAELGDVPVDYVTVEPNAGMADAQRARGLRVVPDASALGAVDGGVILANEVLDALPVHRVVQTVEGLRELLVTYAPGRGFREEPGDLSTPALREHFEGVDLADGQVAEACLITGALARTLAGVLRRGYALLVDYGDERPRIHAQERAGGTVRGFSRHRLEEDVFKRVGEQDVTASVDFTHVKRAFEDAGFRVAGYGSQGEVLVNLGIVDDHQDAASADPFAALKMKTLFVPGGMGDAFKVLALARDAPADGLLAFTPRGLA